MTTPANENRRFTRIDADLYSGYAGEELALGVRVAFRGARRTILAGRRTRFWLTAGIADVQVPAAAEGSTTPRLPFLDRAETQVLADIATAGEPFRRISALVPNEDGPLVRAALEDLAHGKRDRAVAYLEDS